MPLARWAFLLVASTAGTLACRRDDPGFVRGSGMSVGTLPPESQARVYEAAAKGAFDLDQSLSLLLDQRMLPRGVGLKPDGRVSDAVLAEMRRRALIRGTCEPPLGVTGVPRCTAALPGYILRYSPVFALGPDSVQVYVYVQKYDTPNSEPSQTLRFERAYQVVRHGDDWSAVREARVPGEIRGERNR